MSWRKPWRPASSDVAHRRREGSHGSLFAIATTAVHIGAVAWWTIACTPLVTPPAPAPPRVVHVQLPDLPPAEPPSTDEDPKDDDGAPAGERFTWLELNRARPNVLLAWTTTDVALSNDDGRSFVVAPLPASQLPLPPLGVVTPSGAALLTRDARSWWRMKAGGAPVLEPATLPGEVRGWTADAKRILAVATVDDIERFYVSTDDARTWTEGPQPPREVYDLTVRPGGRVVLSWAWSASCGGGGEGQATWSTGDVEWTVDSRQPIGMLGADDWIYVGEHRSATSGMLLTGHGPKDRVAFGPAIREEEGFWSATDGRSTYVGSGATVFSVRGGVFSSYDDNVPPGIRDVSVDGRGRLVGLSERGIVRHDDPFSWNELDVPSPPP